MAWSFLQDWGYDGTNDLFDYNQKMHTYENTTNEDQLVRSYFVYFGTGNATYVSVNSDKTDTYSVLGKGVPFTMTAFATGSDGVKSTTASVVRTNADGTTTTYGTTATVDNKVGRRSYSSSGFTCYTVQESECLKYEFTFDKPVRVAANSSVDFYIDFNKVSSDDYNVVAAQNRRAGGYGGTVTEAYFTVTYNANGGTQPPISQTKTPGVDLTITPLEPMPPEGKKFLGWGLTASDTTVAYDSGDLYTEDADITLYALWEWITYTITYHRNDYDVLANFPSNQIKTYGQTLTLSSKTPTIRDVVTEYTVTFDANGGQCSTSSLTAEKTESKTFKNWNTKADGTGTAYAKSSAYTSNSAATLYLQTNDPTYSTESITLPTATRAGYEFLGWASTATAVGGTTGSYTPTSSLTLFAIWAAEGLVYIDNGTTYEPYTIWIDNGSSWDQYMAYIDNGSSWELYTG